MVGLNAPRDWLGRIFGYDTNPANKGFLVQNQLFLILNNGINTKYLIKNLNKKNRSPMVQLIDLTNQLTGLKAETNSSQANQTF